MMIGRTLGHYKVVEKLGEGGMGEVYRATDTKLGRGVALKVLPPEMASDPGRIERFQREARAVAALNHPHIVTIHSVEEADSVHFITMELVEGQSLEKLIPREGLEPERFFDLAIPLAEAIAAAHDRGITHRDLKPANIMITDDGRLKVLDFGLAKLQRLESDPALSQLPTEAKTREGMIVGTIPYMSPEQIEGRNVDHRTDVFSLGIIFYEMATGKRPFEGKSSPALMSAILKDAPQSVTSQRQDLPHRLERLINRCLAKAPNDRYQTTREALEELEASRAEKSSGITEYRSTSSESPHAKGFWVAVLPFKHRGTNPDVEALAEGLSEDITTGLSKFSYLYVVSHNSTSRYKDQAVDVREVGKELGARYVMEGGLRQSGTKVRINVQLLDTLTGTHLWAETFDRNLETADVFEVQDEITDRVVSTVADPFGVLARSMAAPTDGRPPESLTPYESVLRWFLYQHRVAPEDHLVTRIALERAVELEPRYADAWACLTVLYLDEDRHEFNRRPHALDRALGAARRAVDADPANQLANYALAQAYYFRGDVGSFRSAAERAISLNHRDGNTMAMLGILMGYAGEWERGIELTTTAMSLNPHHPGWYWFTTFFNQYRLGRYEEALTAAQKINLPDYFPTHYTAAIAHARLGNLDAAKASVKEVLRLWPEFEDEFYERHIQKWMPLQPELIEHIVEGLALAGLRVRHPVQKDGSAEAAEESTHASGGTVTPTSATSIERVPRGGEDALDRKSIAVLPFVNRSGNPDEEYFSDGLSEELIHALSRVPGLKVAARSSAFQFRGQEVDVREVGRKLGVATVLEGSIRASDNKLRITTELVSSADGYQLWSERYDREMKDLFETQDEITRAIVDQLQVELVGDTSALAGHATENLEAYRCFLRGRYLRHTKNDHAGALQSYKEAVRLDPTHAPSWLGVAEATMLAAFYSLIPTEQAYAEARKCLETAAKLHGESGEGCYVESMLTWFERQWAAWDTARLRALELEPFNIPALGFFGMSLSMRDRLDEAMVLFDRARERDPLSAFAHASTGIGLLNCGLLTDSQESFEKALAIEDENTLALWGSGVAHVAQRRFEDGITLLERAAEYSRRAAVVLGILGWAHATAGQTEKARAVLDEIRSRPESSPAVATEAWLLAALGRKDEAWEVVERAEEERQGMLYFLGLPPFSLLHGDSRWNRLLRRFELPTPPEESPSIAVLPFVNMSADEENQYFSDGLTEELIADLAGIKALSVISRTSAMRFKGTDKDLRTIGRELGVRYVLEGSVRKAGSSLRITAQLVDAEKDTPLWSEKYSGTLDDVFEVQERVSREIVRKLDVQLTTDESRRLSERPIANVRAFELYLQARQELRQVAGDALERAPKLLTQAIEIEGETPPLLALKAWTMVSRVKAGASRDLRPLDDAETIARTLLDRSPDGPYGDAILGFICYERGQLPEAIRHLKQALERSPNDPDVFFYMCATYMAAGHTEGPIEAGRQMVACDPLSAVSWMCSGAAQWWIGRFDAALPDLERALALDPQNYFLHWTTGYTHAALSQVEEAARHVSFLHDTGPNVPYTFQLQALIDAIEGRPQDAIDRIVAVDVTPLDSHTIFHLAEPLAVAGQQDRALDLIDRSVNGGFYPYPFIAAHCPFLSPLRSLPRFAGILATSKERTEAFLKSERDAGSSSNPTGETD